MRAKKPLPATLLQHARELRQRQTDAETCLWALLRDRRLADCKFRRQHPLGNYILDFYCHEKKLAIELDGGQHNAPAAQIYDERRSAFLKDQGIHVLRFWNDQVLQQTEAVLEQIWFALTAVHSPDSLTPNPLPVGEGGIKTSRAFANPSPWRRSASTATC
ncbi:MULTISPECIES: endonuclease domain-containing protein [Methylococcus]|uniref:endonuclease domain-containing protein n=1 Tax=Methylococcus TaxID=413 RepID=UPI00351BC1DD